MCSTLTAIAPPTAVPPVERPPETARLSSPSGAWAWTVTSPAESSVAPGSTCASVVKLRTWTPTEAATLAVFLPPAAAIAQTMNSFCLLPGATASTVMLPPLTLAPEWTTAVLVTWATFSPTAAPMLVSDSRLMLEPSAKASALLWLTALILIALVAVRTTFEATSAVLLEMSQLTATEAATPTPPLLESPVLSLLSLPALFVESLACGVALPLESFGVLSFVFGLFWTWSLVCDPELLPLSLSPEALALAVASLEVVVVALIVIESACRLRVTSAVVVGSIRLIATAAPTATFLPPALPSAVRPESSSSFAVTAAAPVNLSAPPLPRWAEVWSSTIASDTEGAIATPPAEPALSSVSTSWNEAVAIVSVPQPAAAQVKVAPSSIAARVTLSVRTWIAAEAPIPTLPALASESPWAESASLLCALSVTLPVPAPTLALPPTIAEVWLETMFSPSAPAMLTLLLSPPAPDLPSAEIECSASR